MDAVVPKGEKQSRQGEAVTRQQLGGKLKQLYADIVAEPIPDRFLDLIKQLEAEQEQTKSSDSDQEQKDD